ncbi:xylulose 5-phosphate 3-epimerase [Marinospirillum alkaliphilum]|uniref:Phosphoketolase n=1 Tax=Marinospirillum alkaliphilum DSM 21637 TaxID=1122209 RepID=A0A1K1ZW03_9GAMM|nr:xylulose 5-phosphate 3-epimerase [Marinospirillum alkaliphilum]SFX77629.1 Phosphoketolase [Marinospirillum alkaliphilum DSM 21637]
MTAHFPVAASELPHLEQQARRLREQDADFAAWAQGQGVILHQDLTQVRMARLLDELEAQGQSRKALLQMLTAADHLANAAMWLVVHATYAKRVDVDGRPLDAADFKADPQGHTGGSLNMVPAYVGYLLANLLSGNTRSWLMEQGHCVAAIDSVNLLLGNQKQRHAEAYPEWSSEVLSRFVQDFYSYALGQDGRPASPLGSHANVNTAGAVSEGGYLGFTALQYVHASEAGERLVAFLSDGAFEEQRGSDWAPLWWRAEDTGWVVPVMIANGRRIDQRSTLMMEGGADWFAAHLKHHGFEPSVIDGRDPAAFAWGILMGEQWLQDEVEEIRSGQRHYPARLPYLIAEAPKGYGFPGAGTNRAHGTPLPGNPAKDAESLRLFNEGAARLWQAPETLRQAASLFRQHETQQRPLERDHALASRRVADPVMPQAPWIAADQRLHSPMSAVDVAFCALIKANPDLRVRVGNPDEMSSNNMSLTLAKLKHRVAQPEFSQDEALDGAVITALNEEAVISAVLANKGGLNLAVSYEAFSVKMLGALRQEIIFSRHQIEAGEQPGWRSVPVISSSHLWENGKNEQSHQDSTLAEALLGEMSDVSRVIFPADANSAAAALLEVYRHTGQIANLIIPKRALPSVLSPEQSTQLAEQGALCVAGDPAAPLQLVAVGAYQLQQAMRAWQRLDERGEKASLVYLQEPGRFRIPRDGHEADWVATAAEREALFPAGIQARVFLTHTRPEVLLGHLRSLDLGVDKTAALGYINRGGTLDVHGLLLANRCSWAHLLQQLAQLAGRDAADWMEADELAALKGQRHLTELLPLAR